MNIKTLLLAAGLASSLVAAPITLAATEMLDQVSEFLDSQIDQRIQTLLALMEPILLLGMAVVVGGLEYRRQGGPFVRA